MVDLNRFAELQLLKGEVQNPSIIYSFPNAGGPVFTWGKNQGTGGVRTFMYLKITYGWFAEENRGKTADLDKALQDCLDQFGFFQTNARFDMAKGERCLEFETEESILRDVLSCPHCGKKNAQYFKTCWKCNKDLGSENL